MPCILDAEELDLLAIGAWLLGTGGDGSPYASHLVARQFYEDGGCIALLAPDELADDDAIVVVSTMKAPLVFRGRMTECFLRGSLSLTGLGEDAGASFDIAFQNAFTIGRRDGAMSIIMQPALPSTRSC